MPKPILDPCCGSKMFYFDKQDPRVDFLDNRILSTTLCDGRAIEIVPDRIGCVTEIDAQNGSYNLIVFDPPHLSSAGETGWQAIKYGKLPKDWKDWMTKAFDECWRVLADNGTLVFKWYEYRIKLSEVLSCAPCKPLLGNRRPAQSKTHWIVFFKDDN